MSEMLQLMHLEATLRKERDELRAQLDRIREVYAGAGTVEQRFNEIGNVLTSD